MIVETFVNIYNKRAPRWFKVIKWREWLNRVSENQIHALFLLYLPGYFYFINNEDPLANYLAVRKPQNEEELMEVRRYVSDNPYQRDWEIDDYKRFVPPLYDLSERRRKYPEYYGNKYDRPNRN